MDAGGRAPTVGALGDAGAVAERAGVRRIKTRIMLYFDPPRFILDQKSSGRSTSLIIILFTLWYQTAW